MSGNFSASPVTTSTATNAASFNDLLSDAVINAGDYATAGGTANALTLSLNSDIASYTAGLIVKFKAANTNTATAPTVNINSIGTATIIRPDTSALAVGDIVSGGTYTMIYDGTHFQLQEIPSHNFATVDSYLGSNASQAVTYAHGFGRVPTFVDIIVSSFTTSGTPAQSIGFYDGTNNKCSYFGFSNGGGTGGTGTSTSLAIFILGDSTGANQQAVISWDATNITVTWTKVSSGAPGTLVLTLKAKC